jgi:hypothetical protein
VTAGEVRLLQPTAGSPNRWITQVTLTFDHHDTMDVALDERSRRGEGQLIDVGTRTFKELSVRIDRLNISDRRTYGGLSPVGLAELNIPNHDDVRVDEVIRLPRDMLERAGRSSLDHPLHVVLTRQRAGRAPNRTDPEQSMARVFTLPTARSFAISGAGLASLDGFDKSRDGRLSDPSLRDCRSDLLEVDGHAVTLRMIGGARQSDGRESLAVALCGRADTGIALGPGDHTVRTAPGRVTGIDLNRLVFSSARGGDALRLLGPGRPVRASAPDQRTPKVTVLHQTQTSVKVRVERACRPYWLVLGQSHNSGWRATATGQSLGAPRTIDGYANGWLVRPDPKRAALTVTIHWTPQAHVWAGFMLSAFGVILCGGLVVVNPRDRRTRPPVSSAETGGSLTTAQPQLAFADAEPARPTRSTKILTVTAAFLVLSLLVMPPLPAVVASGLVLLSLHRPRTRTLIALGAVGAVALTGLYIAAKQFRRGFEPFFEWPTFFPLAHDLAWLSIALLTADVVVGLVRQLETEAPDDR